MFQIRYNANVGVQECICLRIYAFFTFLPQCCCHGAVGLEADLGQSAAGVTLQLRTRVLSDAVAYCTWRNEAN